MPIYEELKTEEQKKIAMLQDIAIDIVDKAVKNYVLHGGTAIWRCYNGNRFSYDLDFYFQEKNVCSKISKVASSYHFKIDCIGKGKVYSKLYGYNTHVGIQGSIKKVRGIAGTFLKYNNSSITVVVLSPTNIFLEKIYAYIDRRESKDLYDLYLLARGDVDGRYIIDKAKIRAELNKFLTSFTKPVDNWEDLELMIIHGRLPTLENIIIFLREWIR